MCCGIILKPSKFHYPKYAVGHNTRMLTKEEQKRRNAKRLAKRSYTPEHAKAISERMKQDHKDGKYLEVYGSNNKSSKVELSLLPLLKRQGYVSTQEKKYYIGSTLDRVRIPDYVKRDTREIVEVWGTYWHRGENPQDLLDWYRDRGWKAQVVWENEVDDFMASVNLVGG